MVRRWSLVLIVGIGLCLAVASGASRRAVLYADVDIAAGEFVKKRPVVSGSGDDEGDDEESDDEA